MLTSLHMAGDCGWCFRLNVELSSDLRKKKSNSFKIHMSAKRQNKF